MLPLLVIILIVWFIEYVNGAYEGTPVDAGYEEEKEECQDKEDSLVNRIDKLLTSHEAK